jgi:selenide, water dikinase
MDIKLTSFSHGAGCGCKISPSVLDTILKKNLTFPDQKKLLVGNDSRDDAAVYDLGNGKALISTTDFFMPIVDDPYDFGRIASANAISDVYAMGGEPILAIAILGWPINKIGPEVANEVIRGSREICREANITLAGGHSIDSPEPIFGLAVNGLVDIDRLKRNSTAKEGDLIFLTKSIGIGVLSTAQKKSIVTEEDAYAARESMVKLNKIGSILSTVDTVHAMTDVTGFGLLGHLTEMCEGSGLSVDINSNAIQYISEQLDKYINLGAVPGGTLRNLESYAHKIDFGSIDQNNRYKLADPQTSGGILFSVAEKSVETIISLLNEAGLNMYTTPIGKMRRLREKSVYII